MASVQQMSSQAYEQLQREGPGGELSALISAASSLMQAVLGDERHAALPHWPAGPAPPPQPPQQQSQQPVAQQLPATAGQARPSGACQQQCTVNVAAPGQQQASRVPAMQIGAFDDDDDDDFWDQVDNAVQQHLDKKATSSTGPRAQQSNMPQQHWGAAPKPQPGVQGHQSYNPLGVGGSISAAGPAEAAVRIVVDHDEEAGDDETGLCCSIAICDDDEHLQDMPLVADATTHSAGGDWADTTRQMQAQQEQLQQPSQPGVRPQVLGLFEEVLGVEAPAVQVLQPPSKAGTGAVRQGSKPSGRPGVQQHHKPGQRIPTSDAAGLDADSADLEMETEQGPLADITGTAAALRNLFSVPAFARTAVRRAAAPAKPLLLPTAASRPAKPVASKQQRPLPSTAAGDADAGGQASIDDPCDEVCVMEEDTADEVMEEDTGDGAADQEPGPMGGRNTRVPPVSTAAAGTICDAAEDHQAAAMADVDDESAQDEDGPEVEILVPSEMEDDEELVAALLRGQPLHPPGSGDGDSDGEPPDPPIGCDIEFGFLDDAMDLDDNQIRQAADAALAGLSVPQLTAALAAVVGKGAQQAQQAGAGTSAGDVAAPEVTAAIIKGPADQDAMAYQAQAANVVPPGAEPGAGGNSAAPVAGAAGAARKHARAVIRERLIREILRAHMRAKVGLKVSWTEALGVQILTRLRRGRALLCLHVACAESALLCTPCLPRHNSLRVTQVHVFPATVQRYVNVVRQDGSPCQGHITVRRCALLRFCVQALMGFVATCLKEHAQATSSRVQPAAGATTAPPPTAPQPEQRPPKRQRTGHKGSSNTAHVQPQSNPACEPLPPVPFQALADAALMQRAQGTWGDMEVTPHRLFLALLAISHQTNNSRVPAAGSEQPGVMVVARPQWHWVPGCQVQLQQTGVGQVAVSLLPCAETLPEAAGS